jgi:putative endonuclease
MGPRIFQGVIPAKACPCVGRGQESRKLFLQQMYTKNYYVYILASKRNGTLYIGVTNNLKKRVYEHRNDLIEGFTKKYQVHRLVWYEHSQDIHGVIKREKQLKAWKRQWKMRLIEEMNPEWEDLYDTLVGY